MKTDALNRRLRYAPPDPSVRPRGVALRIEFTDADYVVFEHIDQGGPSSIRSLFEFQKHLRTYYPRFQYRMRDLYHAGYVTRPAWQFNSIDARYQDIVYGLSPRGREALAATGRGSLYPLKLTNEPVHDFMGTCVVQSIQRGAEERGIAYISREQLLRAAQRPLPLEVKPFSGDAFTVIPDDLFKLTYPDGGRRYFALEIDRNTESIETRAGLPGKFGRKIEHYMHILTTGAFKEWGFENLNVLTVTTNHGHMERMIEFLGRQAYPKYANRFLFQCEPIFASRVNGTSEDAYWRMPKGLLTKLLDEPWLSVAGTKDISKP